jgi:translation initiation factor 1 (eIF-1/SUI1)
MDDIEYVGTRLHGGMFAMQHKKRTITIAIDHRVRDMNAVYAINIIERNEMNKLADMIHSDFATDVRINQKNIDQWLSQFR